MKQFILALFAVTFSMTFLSCAKDYTCTCGSSTTIIHDTHSNAKRTCEDRSTLAYKCSL